MPVQGIDPDEDGRIIMLVVGSHPASDAERHLANWQDEIDSAALYRALADLETDARLAEVYRRLAAAEERHAGFWEERLRAAGARVPGRRAGWRTRVLIALARRFGTQLVLPTLNDLERADSSGYDNQPESRGTAMPVEERSHARLLESLSSGRASAVRRWGASRAAIARRAATRCARRCSAPTTGCCRTSAS
jgi:hypothetical protein